MLWNSVITTKGGCFSEAGGKYSIYVDPLNMEELAQKMDECLTYSKKRENDHKGITAR